MSSDARTRAYYPALNALGLIIMIFGLLMSFPLIVSAVLGDGATLAYDQGLFVTFVAGLLLWAATRSKRRDLRVHDGFLLVAATWVVLPLFGALPLLAYIPELGFTDAYFEAVSGLTATGATVLTGLEHLPISINLWRTFMHWVGGMGVIVLVVAILPLLGIGGRQLYKAEVPTPMKDSSLTPRIAETAKGLWLTYVLLTVSCGFSLWWVGLEPWDAVIHAFSVAGLGGFSNRDASLGHFDSVGVELVTIGFALLAGLNYATHYLALVRRSSAPYRRDPEIPFYFGVLALSTGMLTVYLLAQGVFSDVGEALRYVAFHVVSISTSLGLATHDYTLWPMFAQIWILFLGSFVACSGSTGGGIKMMRAMILYKQVFREIVRSLHPNAVRPVRMGRNPVPENILHAVLGFSFMYMVSIVSLTLVLSAAGLELVTAFSAVVACLNNTGPGLGLVGPASNYQALGDFHKWVLCFAMILGRLEIFTFLVVLTPTFWRR
ncbi:MAG TPA: potassium transporter TrkG [Thauera sp.]|mgnify:CR=1 FL=1|jgi:trk system potassium uptake protein TrkH|uniref:TrkH family potassium uptake protein n=1 Tax=Thauera sp. TaxID=1905334 RepID=UPI000FB1AF14|nr:potassium transporter TrkG [Thauera sp.]RTL19248.1 MAG: TrkH family potassium uptake protein [Rhodocyclaceae bacterium]MCB1944828.1 TrkH family potassium uptake protein [Thauera sp.]MCP5226790.1 TrkH family potassium uptake protein [Thauera sp.]HPE04678.1 potassium transporter TrkG [Thauera sp.]HRV77569.1 potassium transporter TrkG [Thauera sp.]